MLAPFVKLLFLSTFAPAQDCPYYQPSFPVCVASLPCSIYSVSEIRNNSDHQACIQEVKTRMAFNNCSDVFAVGEKNKLAPFYLQCAMDRYELRVESACGYIPTIDYPATGCSADCKKKAKKIVPICYQIIEVCKKRQQNSSSQELISLYNFQYESLYKKCINSIDLDL